MARSSAKQRSKGKSKPKQGQIAPPQRRTSSEVHGSVGESVQASQRESSVSSLSSLPDDERLATSSVRQAATSSSSRQVSAAGQAEARRKRIAKFGNTDLLADYLDELEAKGLGLQGADGRLDLCQWEASPVVHHKIVELWPRGPRSHVALLEFMRKRNTGAVKPHSLTSFRHRYILGLSQAVFGRLEDVRWLMFSGYHPWTEEQATYINTYDSTPYVAGQTQSHASAANDVDPAQDEWVFTDRHRPGPPEPRHPLHQSSGGVFAACFLAAVWLRTSDVQNGYGEETQPTEMLEGEWACALSRVYRSCWALREIRTGNIFKTGSRFKMKDHRARMRHAHTVDLLVKELITFVWRQCLRSEQATWRDTNMSHCWKLITEHCEQHPQWLKEAWARLKSFARDPHQESHGAETDDWQEQEDVDLIYANADDEEVSSAQETDSEFESVYTEVDDDESDSSMGEEVQEEAMDLDQAQEPDNNVPVQAEETRPDEQETSEVAAANHSLPQLPPQVFEEVPICPVIDLVDSDDDVELVRVETAERIPQNKAELLELIREGKPVPPYQLGTTTSHYQMEQQYPDGRMEELAVVMGNITLPVDRDILDRATFLKAATSARVHDAEEDDTNPAQEATEDDDAPMTEKQAVENLVRSSIDRVHWYSHWHALTVDELQKRLRFWCQWALKHPNKVPAENMEGEVRKMIAQLDLEEPHWTLESFLGLREYMGKWRVRDGFKRVSHSTGIPKPLRLSHAQLESALWFIHRALSSKEDGQDVGSSEYSPISRVQRSDS